MSQNERGTRGQPQGPQPGADEASAVAPGPVTSRLLDTAGGTGESRYATPYEHWTFGSTTGVSVDDALLAARIWDDVPDVRAHALRRLLTVLTVNGANAELAKYPEEDRDEMRIYSTREGAFVQGSITCFDAGTLIALNRQGLSVRMYLATLTGDEVGETTDEWRVQVVRTRVIEGDPPQKRSIPLEEQEVVTREALDRLALSPTAAVDLELDPVDLEQTRHDHRWLHFRDTVLPYDYTGAEPPTPGDPTT